MADAGVTRARFPSLERRSLVYWTGDKGGPSISLVDTEVTSVIALSLANANRNQRLIEDARGLGLGALLDGEAWRGQLAPDHRMRKSGTPAGLTAGEVVDPDAALFAREWRHAFTEAYVEALVVGGATILTTPGHFSLDPVGVARRNDLELARDMAAAVSRRRLTEPGPGDANAHARRLFATIAVQPSTLTDAAVDDLIAAYATLEDMDGFMMWAFKCGPSKRQFQLLRRLAVGLQAATGKPAVVGGLGQLWKLGLASGIAAVCFGHQRSQLAWPPPEQRPVEPGEKPKGRGVAIYHPGLLGGFRIGKLGVTQREAMFALSPCDCGHHAAGDPPEAQNDALAHNVAMTMSEARLAVTGTPSQALGRMLARAVSADRQRMLLRMGKLPSAWRLTLSDFPDLAQPAEERTS